MPQQAVIKVTNSVIEKMKQHYQPYLSPKIPPYAVFSGKKAGTTITAYQSGKVLFQGPQAAEEAGLWGSDLGNTTSAKKNAKKPTGDLPKDFAKLSVLGSDEVGNGSYFGPLVVSAVYASKEKLALLRELGVKDSKMLTDTLIRQIAKDIEVSVPHKTLVVTPEKYNAIQPRYNAVHMKVALHNQVIALLLQELAPEKPEAILIDQFTPEKNFKKYAAGEKLQISEKIYFATKGEQEHLAVAAASILCRARFLEELEKESAKVGITLPSGAHGKADLVAAQLLKKGGMELLGKYAKLHFANTQKALKLIGKK